MPPIEVILALELKKNQKCDERALFWVSLQKPDLYFNTGFANIN